MFPAYSKHSENTAETREDNDWLVNLSFQVGTECANGSVKASASSRDGGPANTSSIRTVDEGPTFEKVKESNSKDSPSVPLCSSPTLSYCSKESRDSSEVSDAKIEKGENVHSKTLGSASGSSLKNRTTRGHENKHESSESSDDGEEIDKDVSRNPPRDRLTSRSRRRYRDSSTSSSEDSYRNYERKQTKKGRRRESRSSGEERKYGKRHTSSKLSKRHSHKEKRRVSRSESSSSSEDKVKSSSRRRHKDDGKKKNRSRDHSKSCQKETHCEGGEIRSQKSRSALQESNYRTDEIPPELFYEDRDRDVNNLTVSRLSRPIAARCFVKYPIWGLSKYSGKNLKRKNKKGRYYEVLRDPVRRAEILGESSELKAMVDIEEERSTRTAYFNRALAEDPSNVKLWLDYIDFQDAIRMKRHHSGGDRLEDANELGRDMLKVDRSTVERKLCIVEKALGSNPDSDELWRRRCQYAAIILPDEKYREELTKWAIDDPSKISLWRSLLFHIQSSLSACRASAVCKTSATALEKLHALRRSKHASPAEVALIEHKILSLLLELGLFLRQAGLSEMLWSVLNVYLELNLARLERDKIRISSCVPEKDLRDLEDAVLSSELPMPTLWMRVETLRAGVHWLSLGIDEDCEDPQRMILPEDTADLVQPVRTSSLLMRLVLIVLSLLKVPLLPWRETTNKALGLGDVPWALDGPEMLLASVFRCGTFESRRAAAALVDSIQTASGAQYLATRPGQDQYIEFLCSVFLSCADCLPDQEQTMICVWWLRFCRFLLQLDAWKLFTLPRGRAKKLRSAAKDLLKKEQNRNNVSLFCEFALLEREISGVEPACKVLRGAISVLPTHTPVPALNDRGPVCALYRTLVELLIASDERLKAKGVLVSVGNGTPLEEAAPSATAIEKALSKFHHVSTELLAELESFVESDEEDGAIYSFHLSFDFVVEWLTCQAWLLFLTDSVWKAVAMLENALSSTLSQARIIGCRREALWEVYGHVLGLHCRDTCGSYGVLREVVLKALKEFPNNMALLGILCDIETSDLGFGLPQWQLSRSLCSIPSPAAHALLVFLVRFRVQNQAGSLGLRQMMTLLRRLTRSLNPHSPLLWRIYLQLVSVVGDDKTLKNTWYLALEGCPWVKALYLDAVQALPSELGRIQDLLEEKELRLHVTPEELDILRGD